MNTLVYAYGAKPPVSGATVIDEQISLAHRYFNKLIELHRAQREAVATTRAALCPELEAAEAAVSVADEAVETCVASIRRRNAAERRKRASAAEQEDLAALKELRAVAWADVKAARAAAATPEILAVLDGIYQEGAAARRQARGECGVFWGSYLVVEAAVEAACKSPAPPRFRRWNGDGQVAVQIQKGMTATEALACQDTRLRLEHVKDRGRRAPLYVMWIRVGSVGRDPLWAKVPFYLHRPLPDDALIMGASLLRRQVAVRRNSAGEWRPYYEWSVNITLRTGLTKPVAPGGACGIDLGWRLMEDGSLRVAYIVGDDDRNEQLALPADLLGRIAHSDDIQAIRDDAFNHRIAELRAWMAKIDVPAWLAEATTGIAQWKAKSRLASLLSRWQRFPGDEQMHALLSHWQARDAHLWQYERHNLIKALAQRRHLYRTFAAQVRERYRTITVEDCDWRKLARLPEAGSNEAVNATARRNQRIAAVGMLRQCLVAAGAVPNRTENTTRECCRCGHINDWPDRLELVHTCANCGEAMDQDENAAWVLLARGRVADSSGGNGSAQTAVGESDAANSAGGAARVPEAMAGQDVAPCAVVGRGRWARRKLARSQRTTQDGAGQEHATMAGANPAHGG